MGRMLPPPAQLLWWHCPWWLMGVCVSVVISIFKHHQSPAFKCHSNISCSIITFGHISISRFSHIAFSWNSLSELNRSFFCIIFSRSWSATTNWRTLWVGRWRLFAKHLLVKLVWVTRWKNWQKLYITEPCLRCGDDLHRPLSNRSATGCCTTSVDMISITCGSANENRRSVAS